jgi:hypothetical protein
VIDNNLRNTVNIRNVACRRYEQYRRACGVTFNDKDVMDTFNDFMTTFKDEVIELEKRRTVEMNRPIQPYDDNTYKLLREQLTRMTIGIYERKNAMIPYEQLILSMSDHPIIIDYNKRKLEKLKDLEKEDRVVLDYIKGVLEQLDKNTYRNVNSVNTITTELEKKKNLLNSNRSAHLSYMNSTLKRN